MVAVDMVVDGAVEEGEEEVALQHPTLRHWVVAAGSHMPAHSLLLLETLECSGHDIR